VISRFLLKRKYHGFSVANPRGYAGDPVFVLLDTQDFTGEPIFLGGFIEIGKLNIC
jgi:hypothetical protein